MLGAMAAQAAVQKPLRLPHKVRLAIIGLEGHSGAILGSMDRLPDIELVAVQDRNPTLVQQVTTGKYGTNTRQYDEWRELLDREKLEMVGIFGTNGERAEIIIECARRKLHIVADKPLAITTADLKRVKQAVAASGVSLTMWIPMRSLGPYRALKQIIAAGEIGEVAQISAQKSWRLGELAGWMLNRATFGGTIPFKAIHMVDLIRWTSGRELVETVSFQGRVGFSHLREMENTTATIFRLDNHGTATLYMDFLRPDTLPTWGDDRLRLAGTLGVAEFQEATGVTVITASKPPRQIRDLPPDTEPFLEFLESVYHGKAPDISLRDIYRVNEIVLAARDSADRHEIVQI